MRHLLDASALIAFLRGEPAADRVETVLNRGSCAIVTANLAETLEVVMRIDSVPRDTLEGILAPLLDSQLDVIELTTKLAWQAAELRALHYHRSDLPVSLADCTLLAAATSGDTVVTSDLPMLRLASRLERKTLALPDSSGKTASASGPD